MSDMVSFTFWRSGAVPASGGGAALIRGCDGLGVSMASLGVIRQYVCGKRKARTGKSLRPSSMKVSARGGEYATIGHAVERASPSFSRDWPVSTSVLRLRAFAAAGSRRLAPATHSPNDMIG
jgi:hypothetical protein